MILLAVALPAQAHSRERRYSLCVHYLALVAQWIERPPPKGKAAGSIPAQGTK